jgi:hypothetical protein
VSQGPNKRRGQIKRIALLPQAAQDAIDLMQPRQTMLTSVETGEYRRTITQRSANADLTKIGGAGAWGNVARGSRTTGWEFQRQ